MVEYRTVDGELVIVTVCAMCDVELHRKRDKRPALCSAKCRNRAYRIRKRAEYLRAEFAKIAPDLDKLEHGTRWPRGLVTNFRATA